MPSAPTPLCCKISFCRLDSFPFWAKRLFSLDRTPFLFGRNSFLFEWNSFPLWMNSSSRFERNPFLFGRNGAVKCLKSIKVLPFVKEKGPTVWSIKEKCIPLQRLWKGVLVKQPSGHKTKMLHKLLWRFGEMVEWSITTVLKTVVPRGTGGSNPSLSAISLDYQWFTKFTPKKCKVGCFFYIINAKAD